MSKLENISKSTNQLQKRQSAMTINYEKLVQSYFSTELMNITRPNMKTFIQQWCQYVNEKKSIPLLGFYRLRECLEKEHGLKFKIFNAICDMFEIIEDTGQLTLNSKLSDYVFNSFTKKSKALAVNNANVRSDLRNVYKFIVPEIGPKSEKKYGMPRPRYGVKSYTSSISQGDSISVYWQDEDFQLMKVMYQSVFHQWIPIGLNESCDKDHTLKCVVQMFSAIEQLILYDFFIKPTYGEDYIVDGYYKYIFKLEVDPETFRAKVIQYKYDEFKCYVKCNDNYTDFNTNIILGYIDVLSTSPKRQDYNEKAMKELNYLMEMAFYNQTRFVSQRPEEENHIREYKHSSHFGVNSKFHCPLPVRHKNLDTIVINILNHFRVFPCLFETITGYCTRNNKITGFVTGEDCRTVQLSLHDDCHKYIYYCFNNYYSSSQSLDPKCIVFYKENVAAFAMMNDPTKTTSEYTESIMKKTNELYRRSHYKVVVRINSENLRRRRPNGAFPMFNIPVTLRMAVNDKLNKKDIRVLDKYISYNEYLQENNITDPEDILKTITTIQKEIELKSQCSTRNGLQEESVVCDKLTEDILELTKKVTDQELQIKRQQQTEIRVRKDAEHLDKERTTFEQYKKETQQQLKETQVKLARENNRLSQLKQQLTVIERKQFKREKALDKQDKKLDDIEQILSKREDELDKIEEGLDNYSLNLENMADDLRKARQSLKCKEDELKIKEQDLIDKEAELKKKEAELNDREADFEKIYREFFDKVCELSKKDRDLNDKESKLNDKEAVLNDKEAVLNDKEAVLKKKEQDLIDRKDELNEREVELMKKSLNLNNKEAELEKKEKDLFTTNGLITNSALELTKYINEFNERTESFYPNTVINRRTSIYGHGHADFSQRRRGFNYEVQESFEIQDDDEVQESDQPDPVASLLKSGNQDSENTELVNSLQILKRHINDVVKAFRQVLDGTKTDVVIKPKSLLPRVARTYQGFIEDRRQEIMSRVLQMKFFKNISKRLRTVFYNGNDSLDGISWVKFEYLAQIYPRIDCVIQLLLEMFACVTNEIHVSMKNSSYMERRQVSTIKFNDSSNIKCLILDQQATANQETTDNGSLEEEPKENELTNGQTLVDV